MVGLGEDATTLFDVVSVQANDERLVGLVTQGLQCADDAVGNCVTRGDAAEDVDEHALDLCIVEDDIQAGSHDCSGSSAADVEEVGGLDATVVLAGVCDDVQGGHDQACAVADDSDLTVELDVVEVVFLGLELEGIGSVAILECLVAGLTERCVLVEGDLAVEGEDLIVRRTNEGVDLDEECVFADEDLPQLLDRHGRCVEHLCGQLSCLGDAAREREVDALDCVDGDLGESVGVLLGGDLDLDATLYRAHGQVGALVRSSRKEM